MKSESVKSPETVNAKHTAGRMNIDDIKAAIAAPERTAEQAEMVLHAAKCFPDLLEACKTMLEAWGDQMHEADAFALRTLIAKAEGNQ